MAEDDYDDYDEEGIDDVDEVCPAGPAAGDKPSTWVLSQLVSCVCSMVHVPGKQKANKIVSNCVQLKAAEEEKAKKAAKLQKASTEVCSRPTQHAHALQVSLLQCKLLARDCQLLDARSLLYVCAHPARKLEMSAQGRPRRTRHSQ